MRVHVVAGVVAALTIAACRRHLAKPQPLSTTESYCWWTAMRTSLPVDSVAVRFQNAFIGLGLGQVTSQREGDTIWVHAGPAVIPQGSGHLVREARAVAYRSSGDTTRFRYYNGLGTPPEGWSRADTTNAGGMRIGFCGEIGKAVHIQAWTLRTPNADDSLPVWTRRP